jgi:hypothetical protein
MEVYEMSALLEMVPLAAALNEADCLEYDPPETSVPESASVGLDVYSAK